MNTPNQFDSLRQELIEKIQYINETINSSLKSMEQSTPRGTPIKYMPIGREMNYLIWPIFWTELEDGRFDMEFEGKSYTNATKLLDVNFIYKTVEDAGYLMFFDWTKEQMRDFCIMIALSVSGHGTQKELFEQCREWYYELYQVEALDRALGNTK